jgi:hypothetical protein
MIKIVTIEVRQAFRAWLFLVSELPCNSPVDLNKIWKGFESPPKLLREAPAFRPGYSLRTVLKDGVST